MPHSRSNGAFEAIAVLPAIRSRHIVARAPASARGMSSRPAPPRASSMLRDAVLHRHFRHAQAHRRADGGACPALRPSAVRTRAGCNSRSHRRAPSTSPESSASASAAGPLAGHARTGPTFIQARCGSDRIAGAMPPIARNRRGAACLITQAKMRNASLSQRFCPSRASAFFTSERRSSSTCGISIFTGQTSAQAPHRLDANGSVGSCITPRNCGVMMAPIGPE